MAKILSSGEIGFRLKQLRQQAGISQEKLAELVGGIHVSVAKVRIRHKYDEYR